ncbi:U11/U12 small nuclear ribonucleoprotein 25 kDa protein isoform X2 [Cryptomeria japonica]|uniref:U11/U12 small nuclear ribonucleoprotein 25 kDa protein isoform X2 n=1 Tax=Cryptomeria japonica TaxID=3369 RepID=UPI0025AB8A3F|nr:U11/U12 small nuclear ribonucleoprotein 25 kDa protein isoform X2 [Cryptomeria japonica]
MEDYSNLKRARLQSLLSTLLDDPVLKDVPKNPNVADVNTLISLEQGSAMKLFVLRMDNTIFVPNSASVKDLKSAVTRKVNEMEQSKMGHRHISWRHVWSNFCLSYANQNIIDDKAMLQDFGIRNNSQIHFVPYLASKEQGRHSRSKKRRFFHGLSKHS